MSGIAEVLPSPLLTLLTASEFNDMVCGNPDFDVNRLREAVRLDGYSSSSDQIRRSPRRKAGTARTSGCTTDG